MIRSRPWRSAVALMLVLLTPACTTWRVERLAPQALLARNPSTLRVMRTDSSMLVLQDPELQGDTLVGTGAKGAEVRVPLDSVRQTSTRRFSPLKTFGVLVGMAATAVVGLAIYISSCNCFGD